ncbi:pyrimidine 5-nucleotidase [Ascobolus immersus RN42]|uniref:Pyrimidine 5-nucleotidase n=1 Tax=Ascobolus immersus RN42 TaxID=1160509 RepID=A0A3N4I984_ASCIM|nr:pyrimidine 5-nucleotidase [Ascobolus immersus RN42]
MSTNNPINVNGASPAPTTDEKPVFFFDIDNCLYSRSYKIHDLMKTLITDYFTRELSLPKENAEHLHLTYYRSYGLAIEGLVRHHSIDPLDYNTQVDDALPLEQVFTEPDLKLREFLLELKKKNNCRLWLFTNAYINHARRVIKLLGLGPIGTDEDCIFEGVTFCDYGKIGTLANGEGELICKPKGAMFRKAMEEAGIKDVSKCYFVDDSYINCSGAVQSGWTHTAHLLEPEDPLPKVPAAPHVIRSLYELKDVFPELWK